jgi:hypothetical protein
MSKLSLLCIWLIFVLQRIFALWEWLYYTQHCDPFKGSDWRLCPWWGRPPCFGFEANLIKQDGYIFSVFFWQCVPTVLPWNMAEIFSIITEYITCWPSLCSSARVYWQWTGPKISFPIKVHVSLLPPRVISACTYYYHGDLRCIGCGWIAAVCTCSIITAPDYKFKVSTVPYILE